MPAHRIFVAPRALMLAAVLTVATFACVLTPARASEVIRTAKDVGSVPPPISYEFSLDEKDEAAIEKRRAARRATERAGKARKNARAIDERIYRLEELINDAMADEQRLREALESQLVERYIAGDLAAIELVGTADSLQDALRRASLWKDGLAEGTRLAERHELALQRLEELRMALEEARDGENSAAVRLTKQAARADGQLAANQVRHESELEIPPEPGSVKASHFMLIPGEFASTAWLSALSGFGQQGWLGNVTPARPATQEQIARALGDPRLDIYAGGRVDIASGRIDGRVLDVLTVLADNFGSVTITSLTTGHGVYTSNGSVSAHTYGCAVDIGAVAGVRIEPSTQGPGSITDNAVRLLAALQGDLLPHQIISLISIGGPTMAMGDHGDHIHVGFSC